MWENKKVCETKLWFGQIERDNLFIKCKIWYYPMLDLATQLIQHSHVNILIISLSKFSGVDINFLGNN